MNKFTKAFIAVACLSSWIIAGCSKNESTTASSADQAKAVERVNQANLIFVPRLALVISSEGKDTTGFDMSAATSLYKEALTYDPDNVDAHFGIAVTEFFTVFSDPSLRSAFANLQSPTSLMSVSPFSVFDRKSGMERFGGLLNGSIKSNLAQVIDPMYPVKMARSHVMSVNGQPFSYYQGLIETKVLPSLSDAISHLNIVTQHSSYIFYITPEEVGENIGDSIRIGLTEIYVLLATCQTVDAGASLVVAYNVDYDATDSSAVKAAWQPNSAFLALRSGGAQRMKDVRTNIIAAATSIQSGVNFLIQHPANGIIPYRSEDAATLSELKSAMDSVKTYLSGPVQISVSVGGNSQATTTITVNLKNVFDNAIPNFKLKLPGYTVSIQPNGTHYDAVLMWQAASFSQWIFPDPTFNNILPGITSDALLKQTFGITSSGWQPYVIIPG